MGMRIRFAEPRPAGRNVYDHILLPRLGLPLMGTILRGEGHDVRIYCEVLAPLDRRDCAEADLVGISATTATQPAAYALADELSAAGVPVVLGGPHVTFCPDEALAHAPYVVRGEGEHTIVELVDAIGARRDPSDVAGLSWRSADGRAHHNPPRARCSQEQFEALPIPDLSLIAGHERMGVKPIMTQWGCPYDCEFCSVTAQFSRHVRYRRTDQVLAELDGLRAREVFFHDDNFVVDKRRTRALLQAMIEAGLTPEFSAQMRADTVLASRSRQDIDEDFLELLARAGCRMAMVGFETISDEGLRRIGKKTTLASSEAAVHAFHRHGIAVHGMFVAGLDGDHAGSAEEMAAFARRLQIDTFQLMMVTPAPGTRLWERVSDEERLLCRDWSLFDGHHAVMRPAGMTPLELQLGTVAALRSFYSPAAIALPAARGLVRQAPALLAILARRAPALLARPWRRVRAGAQLVAESAQVSGAGADVPQGRKLSERAVLAMDRFAESLSREERDHLFDALGVAGLRLYGRRRVAEFLGQEHSRRHLAYLASLG
ncbi:MAG TPA: radical SAM protein [Solirubrobacteraceae bacterium]|nr:radical SAM protein [Solirubrobacteraceae bacterium]